MKICPLERMRGRMVACTDHCGFYSDTHERCSVVLLAASAFDLSVSQHRIAEQGPAQLHICDTKQPTFTDKLEFLVKRYGLEERLANFNAGKPSSDCDEVKR